MSAGYRQAHGREGNRVRSSSYEVREHMCLDMVDRDVGDFECDGESFCYAYAHEQGRHQSGKLRAGDDIHFLQCDIRLGQHFFQNPEDIVCMEPCCYFGHHSLRLVVLTDLGSGFHSNQLSFAEYRNRGVVTRGFKGEEEHEKL